MQKHEMWPGPALLSGQTGRGLTVFGKYAYFDEAKLLNSCLSMCVPLGFFFFLCCSVKNMFAWNNTTSHPSFCLPYGLPGWHASLAFLLPRGSDTRHQL